MGLVRRLVVLFLRGNTCCPKNHGLDPPKKDRFDSVCRRDSGISTSFEIP